MFENRVTPSTLYVPLQPSTGTDTRTVDLRILSDGRVGLAAYSSLNSLVQHCGDAQPWGLVDEQGVADIRSSADIDVTLLDAPLPLRDKRVHATGNSPAAYLVDPLR